VDQFRGFFSYAHKTAKAARNLLRLGTIALTRSEHEEARARYGEALPLFKKVGSLLGEANCIQGLGDIARSENEIEGARKAFTDALSLHEKIQEPYIQSASHICVSWKSHSRQTSARNIAPWRAKHGGKSAARI
jgi:tetratricopeptide (TPR) repeat protein